MSTLIFAPLFSTFQQGYFRCKIELFKMGLESDSIYVVYSFLNLGAKKWCQNNIGARCEFRCIAFFMALLSYPFLRVKKKKREDYLLILSPKTAAAPSPAKIPRIGNGDFATGSVVVVFEESSMMVLSFMNMIPNGDTPSGFSSFKSS